MNLSDNRFQSEQPLILDFWAPWCAPCRATKPVLEKLAGEYSGRVAFQELNADDEKTLLQELKIFSIPTLIVLQNGEVVKRIVGAQTPAYYRRLFETLSSGDLASMSGPSMVDRILRLGAGAVMAFLAYTNGIPWLLPVGLIIMFTGVYDRCPIWQAVSARFRKTG